MVFGFIFKKKEDPGITIPSEEKFDIKSLQYEIFREEEKRATIPRTIYERLTHLASRLNISPDEQTKKKFEEAIEFAHLRVTPEGVYSLSLLFGFVFFIIGILAFFFTVYVDLFSLMIYLVIISSFSYYLYYYPFHLKKIYELRAGSEIVMLILHIVIYMRNFPNLEGAVRFAAQNLTGPLALDVKKLLWDVHVGTYESMEQALLSFSFKWKSSFRAFSDSINAIIYSLYTSGKRRMELLDESVDIILTSLAERSNSYIIRLKNPITLINALGILLPVLVLTMVPVAAIFLKDLIHPFTIFGFYDIVLPIALVFIIKNVLDQRVITLPEPDLSLHPDLPPENTFKVKNVFVYCYVPAILVLLPFLGFWYFHPEASLYESFVITIGFFISVILYFFLNSFQKIKLRREIVGMEDEFRDILFGLGQEIDRGIPIEVGLEKILPTLRGNYSVNLVNTILKNIKYEGMTIEQAIFDEREGAIRKYPSRLIHSTLKAVVDAATKGTKIVSEIMISISKYLTNIHKTQESLQDKFSEIVGSMQMQARILLPLICAVMNVISYVIIEMVNFLGKQMENLHIEGTTTAAGYTEFIKLFKGGVMISPGVFQLAIGFYVIETIIILSWFVNGISVGVDKISLYDTIYRNLVVGAVLYFLICIISLILFIPILEIVKSGIHFVT